VPGDVGEAAVSGCGVDGHVDGVHQERGAGLSSEYRSEGLRRTVATRYDHTRRTFER
jgi:hypothetical protein